METEDFKGRVKRFAASKGMSINEFQERLGVSNSYFSNVGSMSPKVALKLREVFPDANIEWLNTGKGSMLNNREDTVNVSNISVPLLPVLAVAGQLSDFVSAVHEYDCEKIISPVANAQLAMYVTGDSMSPEYPDGSIVFMQRINENAFIEWGKVYVLDTVNGVVMKKIFPSKSGEDSIECRSINPNYNSYDVRKEDIFGWYIVRLQMAKK